MYVKHDKVKGLGMVSSSNGSHSTYYKSVILELKTFVIQYTKQSTKVTKDILVTTYKTIQVCFVRSSKFL